MRYLVTLSTAALGFTLMASAPASAQVGVEIGVPGASVEIGEPGHHRHYREERRRYRVHRDENVGHCRTEIEQRERHDGTIVERRVRRCD
jgi:hypothetical protein